MLEDHLLDPNRTVRTVKYTGPQSPYRGAEIFGEEVRSLVTDTALYRETAFTVAVPSASAMVDRLGSYLGGLVYDGDLDSSDVSSSHNQIDCPWMYIRRHFSVSLNTKNFSVSINIVFLAIIV